MWFDGFEPFDLRIFANENWPESPPFDHFTDRSERSERSRGPGALAPLGMTFEDALGGLWQHRFEDIADRDYRGSWEPAVSDLFDSSFKSSSVANEPPPPEGTNDDDIIVTGTRPPTGITYGPEEADDSDGYTGDPNSPYFEGGGGGGSLPSDSSPGDDLIHEQTCSTEAGAADQIRDGIRSTESDDSDRTRSWRHFEYGAYLVQLPDGNFGASSGMIYTDGLSTRVHLDDNIPSNLSSIHGIVHNHPGGGTFDIATARFLAYPSGDDWASAQNLVEMGVPADQLSIWVVDPLGALREFKYSDRSIYEGLSEDQKRQGQSLPTSSTVEGCSS